LVTPISFCLSVAGAGDTLDERWRMRGYLMQETRDGGGKDAGCGPAPLRSSYRFGPFHLLPERQLLLHHDEPVPLGGRAFDLLTLLVSRAGDVVSKAELVAHAWPDCFVHDDNLKVNVAALRRQLADRDRDTVYIATIAGRGYKFVARIEGDDGRDALAHDRPQPAGPPEVPQLYGREEVAGIIAQKLVHPGYVTIAGPGGVGKTSLAIAIAERMRGEFPGGIVFVDLSTIDDPRFVMPALATAVGVSLGLEDPLAGVIAVLRQSRTLLIVDNCEHVSAMAAAAIDRIAAAIPSAAIIATSRAPLRTRHEHVHFLAGLAYPQDQRGLRAREAHTFPAVQLFVARAKSAGAFQLTDDNVESIVSICTRVEGLALAIELAAGNAAIFTPSALDTALQQGLHTLGHGPRQAPLRHQTLEAALDWSYRLLPESEAVLLRLASVFAGRFTADDADALFSAGYLDPLAGRDALAQLVAKSMVSAELEDGAIHYRLVESTRSYARQRLATAPERQRAKRQFASRMRAWLCHAEQAWSTDSPQPWLRKYRSRIDDVRAAIGWAFGPDGDAQIGVDLVVSALPLWQELSAFREMLAAVDLALNARRDPSPETALATAKLTIARAWALTLALRLRPETGAAWRDGIRHAAEAGSVDYQMRAVWGQAVHLAYTGRPREALQGLKRFGTASGLEWSAVPDAERLLAHIEVYAGRLSSASRRLEALASVWEGLEDRPGLSRFQMDLGVAIAMSRSFLLWLTGEPERASGMAMAAVSRANRLGHLISQGNAISLAALPVAYLTGNLETASRLQHQLAQISIQENISVWPGTSQFFAGAIAAARGDGAGLAMMQDGIDELAGGGWLTRVAFYRCILAEALLQSGETDKAEHGLEHALASPYLRQERWCHPEIFRLAGLLRASRGRSTEAERFFAKAVRCARSMQARALELRVQGIETQ
jgi:predicted ATPase/DNA-binding winged helix-turn-helix (wHTH) protein